MSVASSSPRLRGERGDESIHLTAQVSNRDPCSIGLTSTTDFASEAHTPIFKCGNDVDLEHREFSPILWCLPGYIPEGLALLAARPKFGKSWLALDLAIAV